MAEEPEPVPPNTARGLIFAWRLPTVKFYTRLSFSLLIYPPIFSPVRFLTFVFVPTRRLRPLVKKCLDLIWAHRQRGSLEYRICGKRTEKNV